ncbi:MAG: response regulator transcription factor [Acidobacteria bacterium]|nr:response regulator transcription factor [Acidobacteriota bacterium]
MNTVVIVDDEPPARRKLVRLLEPHADFRIAGEAGAGPAAIAVIEEYRPDLLFLDVQMPGLTGFDVLDRLAETIRPLTIFVTAYDQYAVEAFNVRALDYLLKPVSPSRFNAALDRARQQLQSPNTFLKRFLVRDEGITYFVEASDVDWLESARNYVVLHAGNRTHIVRATLEGLLERLDPAQFVRLSRSAAANALRLKAITANEAILKSGEHIKASPRFLAELKKQ